MVTANDLRVIAGATKSDPMRQQLAAAFNLYAPRYGVTSQKSIAQALSNFSVETGGFTKLVESLSYSAERLHAVWPKRFPTLASAKPYARNPKALAEKVYGGRLGNNNPGDGWLYCGKGPGQTTGKANYQVADAATGIAFVAHPDLMADPEKGMIAALALWQKWGLNDLAGRGKTTAIRKRWNGGAIGLSEVEANYARAMKLKLTAASFETPALQAPQDEGAQREAPPPPGLDAPGVQLALVKAGYSIGAIDGIIGPRTKRALTQFQAKSGLAATGAADPATIAALAARFG